MQSKPTKQNISLTFDIRPQVKGRPRFARQGRTVITFTDKKTATYEAAIKMLARSKLHNQLDKGVLPLRDPCKVCINFIFKRPKKPSNEYPYRGDLDNYMKALLDALNKIVFFDDRQIVHVEAKKTYGPDDLIEFELETL